MIRIAKIDDLPKMLEIYNYEIINGYATFDTAPMTLEERKAWFDNHNKDNHPLYVYEDNNEVLGYVSLSQYREKAAYNTTVELSVYVDPIHRGEGIGRKMVEFILGVAKNDPNTFMVVSVITGSNITSIKMHEAFGFKHCGTLENVGIKNGQLLSVVTYALDVR